MNNLKTTVPLNFTRAQKAKRPNNEAVQAAIEKANKVAKKNHRRYLPEPYTR